MHAHCTHAACTLRAHAIHVQVLLKLAETKATITEGDEAGVSLLHYAAKCAVAKWPDVRKRFEAEMLPLSDVSNVKSALVVADIQVPRQRAGHLQPCQAGPATPPSRPCNPAEPALHPRQAGPATPPSQPCNPAKPALQPAKPAPQPCQASPATLRVQVLASELGAVEREYPQHEATRSSSDRFFEVMKPWSVTAKKLLTKLQAEVLTMKEELKALAAYLGDKILPDEPEQVMVRINAFNVSFCKACRDNERAEHLRKKQEKAEAERAARRPSGGAPGATPKGKVPVKAVRSTKDHYMNRIQGSLRRGEFDQMKALQAQMKTEIEGKIGARRASIAGRQK